MSVKLDVNERFVSPQTAYERLNNTVVMFENTPASLHHMSEYTYGIHYFEKRQDVPERIDVNTDERLNFDYPRFGMIQVWTDGVPHCYYLERSPQRVFQMGVSTNNVHVSGISHGIEHIPASKSPLIFKDEPILKMFRNEYPSFELAFKQTQQFNRASVAVSKDVALRRVPKDEQMSLMLRAQEIGIWSPKNEQFLLLPIFEGLNNLLQRRFGIPCQ